MVDKIVNTIALIGNWGYLVIFFAAFLESSAFTGFIVPGESIVVLSGFLAAQGHLEIWDCFLWVAIGAVLGDSVGYAIGKAVGRGYFEKHKRLFLLKEKHIKRADEYFQRRGGKAVFFGRFVGILRAIVPFAAGMSKMPYRRFVIYNVTGGIIWTVCFIILGYFFGHSWQLIEKWSGRAGLFVFFIILVITGFGYIYRTIAKRQTELRGWFENIYFRIISIPYVKRFIQKHHGLIAFIARRLSPKSYMGLHLTIGLALSIAFVWIFGGITEDILTGDPFVVVDQWVLSHILYFRTPMANSFFTIFTNLGGSFAILVGSLIVIIYLSLRKRFDYLVSYITAIIGGSVLVFILKTSIHRVRPISDTSLIKVGGWSFPSGHAMASIIFFGMVAFLSFQDIKSWELRVLVVTASGFIVFLIGLSRIYLQVHYLSDVLAGYVGGLFWLSICITGLEVYRKKVISKTMAGAYNLPSSPSQLS